MSSLATPMGDVPMGEVRMGNGSTPDDSSAARTLAELCLGSLPVGVFVIDDQLVFTYANEALARINGSTVAEHVDHHLLDVLPDIAPASLAALQEVLATGVAVDDLLVDRMLHERRSYSLSYRRIAMPDGRFAVCGSIADVSERAKAAEVARGLGERLGRLRDANVIGVMAGEETHILDANDYVLNMLGRTRAEVEAGGLDWVEITPPELRAADARSVQHLREHGDFPVYAKEFVHADGHRVPALVAGTAFEMDPLRWVVLVLDTSTMSRSERRAASLIRIATALATARRLDDILAVVPLVADPLSGLEAIAVPAHALESTHVDAEVKPDPVQLAAATHLIQLVDGDPARGERRGFAIPILDGTDRTAAVIELVHPSGELDVHERSFATALEAVVSAAATQISYREQRRLAELAGALDVMLDMVAIDTAIRDDEGNLVDFRVQWVNRATSDAFGRVPEDMVGSTMLELYPELRGSAFFEAHRRVVDLGEPFEDPEFVFVPAAPGFAPRVYELRVSKFGDGFISCSRDVTQRAEAERAVRRSQQQLEAAQSLARIGSWEWNLDTGERVWSREMHRLLAIDPDLPDEEKQRLSRERIHPEDLHLSDAALARAVELGGSFRYDQRLVLPWGVRLCVVSGDVVEDERGRIFRGTLRDVTEWRKAQDDSAHGRLALEAMQRACLPETMPTAAGLDLEACYRPAHEEDRLGGDWYDAFALPDGRVGLVVGDVTGHGLAAAAVMSQLRNALRAFASEGASPSVVLDSVARFQLQSDIDIFATCLYVVLDPRDGSLTWARAGHPPLIIVDGDRWTAPEAGGGPPLGLLGRGYVEQRAVLPPGGSLVLYTDGLVEERGVEIDIGIERLADLVTTRQSQPLARVVQDAVDELGTGRTYVDDVCLLVARWTPPADANDPTA